MKIRREDSTRTRERLIAAAGEVFSEKDYSVATIADICDRAGVNIAAVNYHFGDKETLYREAWRNTFRAALEKHPEDGGISADAPPEERLRGLVKAFLERVKDESNRGFYIALRELTNPTGLLEEVMETEFWPVHLRMDAVMQELLGPDASVADLQFCAISILNQCFSPILVRRTRPAKEKMDKPFPYSVEDIEAYTEHVMQFSLGGIRAVLEKGRQGTGAVHRQERREVGRTGGLIGSFSEVSSWRGKEWEDSTERVASLLPPPGSQRLCSPAVGNPPKDPGRPAAGSRR